MPSRELPVETRNNAKHWYASEGSTRGSTRRRLKHVIRWTGWLRPNRSNTIIIIIKYFVNNSTKIRSIQIRTNAKIRFFKLYLMLYSL
jgi:hypothetical protein